MRTVTLALINSGVVKGLGQLLVYVCAAAAISYIVLMLRDNDRKFHALVQEVAENRDRAMKSESVAMDLRAQVDDMNKVIWAELEPRVQKQENKPVQRVPTWQGWQQQMMDRVKRLEEWRLRHMSLEH